VSNPKEATLWQCEKCKQYYINKKDAEDCCRERTCEQCGVILDPRIPYTVCSECREINNYDRCKKMTIQEYEKKFPDHMVIMEDEFYANVEDAVDSYFAEHGTILKYVYGTQKEYAVVDIEAALDYADDVENVEFDSYARQELIDFVDKWNEKNKIGFFVATNIAIDIPGDYYEKY
jgi:hypothetical protein